MAHNTPHRASLHLRAASMMYPAAWKLVEEYRRGRGTDYPTWPDWCFLPVAAAAGIVAADAGVPIQALPLRHPERVPDAARLAAFAAWRMTQGIYRFDPALYAAVAETSLDGDLPAEVLYRMPEWCVYLETPGVAMGSTPVVGAWCHLESDADTQRVELRLIIDTDADNDPSGLGLVPVTIHLGAGIAAGLEAMADEAQRQAAMSKLLQAPRAMRAAAAELRTTVEPIVNLLLYVCSVSADISRRGNPERPSNPAPTASKRRGLRESPADGARQWDVGVRIGAALRAAYQREETGGAAAPTGLTVRPHVRRAHWHTIVSGARLREDGSGVPASERDRALRWMPPIPVNVADIDSLPGVVHPVT